MFRYTPFLDDPDFHVHEVDVGSLNAGVLRKPDFDTTLGPERLFLSHRAPKSWADAKKAFNFGFFRIAADGMLKVFEPGHHQPVTKGHSTIALQIDHDRECIHVDRSRADRHCHAVLGFESGRHPARLCTRQLCRA